MGLLKATLRTVVPLALVAATGPGLARSPESPVRLVIVQPGYPGSTESAAGYVRRLTRYLEEEADVPAATGAYFNVPREALAAMRKSPPTHGIVSPGFYLEHRERLGLVPVLEVLPEGRYYLAFPASRAGEEASLAGKRVVGGALYEEKFLRRVVFSEVEGAGSWKAVPTLRITRGLRKLERGDYDAVILNEREHQGLEKLGRLKTLEILRRSEYYPVALFVAFGDRGTSSPGGDEPPPASEALASAATRRLVEALSAMEKSSEGKEILETLGCEGFRPVRVEWLEKLEKRYHGEEKDREEKKQE